MRDREKALIERLMKKMVSELTLEKDYGLVQELMLESELG